MPIIQGRVAIAALSTDPNVLAGSVFEYLPWDALVEIGLVGADGAAGEIEVDVHSGADLLAQSMSLPQKGQVNINEDMYLEDMAVAGDRLQVRATNTNAAIRILAFLVRLTAV